MKNVIKIVLISFLAIIFAVGCHTQMSVSPSERIQHSMARQTESTIRTPEFPRIDKMHQAEIQTDILTQTNAEWIEPNEALFFSESPLIIEAKVLETKEIKYERSADSYTPFSIYTLVIHEVYKDTRETLKAGDEITMVQEFNSEQRPSDLKLPENEHTYMFFITSMDELPDYPLLEVEADYYFAYSYHCLFERVDGYYTSLPWARDYSEKSENLRQKLGITYSEADKSLSYKPSSTENIEEVQVLQKQLDLSSKDYEWLFISNPLLHDAEQFLATVKEHIAAYP